MQLAFLMMVIYSATSLIPIPTWVQYFDAPLFPILIFFMVEGVRVTIQVSWKGAAVLAVLAAVLCWRDVRAEVGLRWDLASYFEVTETVRANSASNANVLSIWSGYVFESGRQYFPGSENQFVYMVAERVSPEERKRYHLISKDEVLRALKAGVPDIYIPVAFRRYVNIPDAEYTAFVKALSTNYSLIKMVEDVPIYRKSL